MEQYAIVFQVLGVLLVLFFGFITYMNTKTWKWVHVTFLLMVFFMVPTFAVYASMTLKTRMAWMTLFQRLEDEVNKYKDSVAILQRGEPNDIKHEKPSVFSVKEDLARMILDRGRVWRGCTPGGGAAGSVTVTIPVAAAPVQPVQPAPMPMPPPMPVDPANPMPEVDPAAQPMPMPMPEPPPPPVVVGHGILEKDILYAFKEVDTGAGFKAPQFYIGEFYVTAVTPDSITMAPLIPLAPDQQQEMNAGNTTWMLFETCPIDTYEIFAGLSAQDIGQFIQQAETGLNPEEYSALINTFVQDGQLAPENTPPDNLWVEVKFIKTHKEEVDTPGAPAAMPPDPNEYPDVVPFDSSGLAVTRRLRRQEGDISEFEPGDTAVIPQEKANELVAAGVAEKVRNIYRRRLIEFSTRLRTIHRRKMELASLTVSINREIATLQAANTKAEEQIALETEHKRLLDEDLAKVTFERDGVVRYGSSLFRQLTQMNNDIRQLYAANHALNLDLKKLTADLTEEADRRTRAATAAVVRP
jgi:hypothetical protein